MKKLYNFILLFFLCFTIGLLSVNAKEIYYTNKNGITFTKEEYDFFSEMYYDGYQAIMNKEDREKFDGKELKIENIEKVIYDESINKNTGNMLKGNYHETQAKKLQISKVTGGNAPTIVITATWKYSPNVRSYDLIGAYLNGVSMIGSAASILSYSGGTIYESAYISSSNGYGSVVKLPSSGSNIIVSSTFLVTGSGTVYGSYQHAKSSISLNNAQQFSISFSGLGNVFYFSNLNIRAKYDAMQGVSINV